MKQTPIDRSKQNKKLYTELKSRKGIDSDPEEEDGVASLSSDGDRNLNTDDERDEDDLETKYEQFLATRVSKDADDSHSVPRLPVRNKDDRFVANQEKLAGSFRLCVFTRTSRL